MSAIESVSHSPRRTHVAALVLIAALASGCGYHLRGSAKLPAGIDSVFVAAPNQIVLDELSAQLRDAEARVLGQAEAADATLRVSAESIERRVLSFDPNTGKEREYELSYTVYFGMNRRDGTVLVPWQRINLLRDFVFDADAVIGKSREEGVLYDEMRRDAVQQMLRRIHAATAG